MSRMTSHTNTNRNNRNISRPTRKDEIETIFRSISSILENTTTIDYTKQISDGSVITISMKPPQINRSQQQRVPSSRIESRMSERGERVPDRNRERVPSFRSLTNYVSTGHANSAPS